MTENKTGPLGILFREETILILFVLMSVINIFLLADTVEQRTGYISAAVVYAALALMAWKRWSISIWAISLLVLLNGVSTLYKSLVGILGVVADPSMLLINLVVGGYFTYGGVVLFQGRHRTD